MAQCTPLILRVVASSVAAANRAGKIIRDIMTVGDLGIVEKAKNDIQTEADRSAQRCIIASLSRQYPALTIIGEEGPSTSCEVPSDWVVTCNDTNALGLTCPESLLDVQEKDIVIWLDPLDGTSEYAKGLVEHVTVLVGIAVNGEPIAGVIHQPYGPPAGTGRTIWGIVGAGIGGGMTPQSSPKDRLVVTTTRSHSNKIVEDALNALKPDDILKVGGAGHKVLLLIEGKANAYVFASGGCKKWDICGPEAVLAALGGTLTDMHGKRYTYDANVQYSNTGGVLATAPGEDHSYFVKKIPEHVRECLQ